MRHGRDGGWKFTVKYYGHLRFFADAMINRENRDGPGTLIDACFAGDASAVQNHEKQPFAIMSRLL